MCSTPEPNARVPFGKRDTNTGFRRGQREILAGTGRQVWGCDPDQPRRPGRGRRCHLPRPPNKDTVPTFHVPITRFRTFLTPITAKTVRKRGIEWCVQAADRATAPATASRFHERGTHHPRARIIRYLRPIPW